MLNTAMIVYIPSVIEVLLLFGLLYACLSLFFICYAMPAK